MTYMTSLRTRAALAIVALLWINLAMMALRYLWGMEADPVIVLGGGAAITGIATLTWWRDRTGAATQDFHRIGARRQRGIAGLLVLGLTAPDRHAHVFLREPCDLRRMGRLAPDHRVCRPDPRCITCCSISSCPLRCFRDRPISAAWSSTPSFSFSKPAS